MGGARVAQAGELRSSRLESLRALAALGVVVSHLSYALSSSTPDVVHRVLRGAGWGVDLFFVLSGYLLFLPFARAALRRQPGVDLRRYASNRALRILPLYYAVVIVLLAVQHEGGTLGQWWRFGFFLENLAPGQVEGLDGSMWSLVVEMQYYVTLPLLALLLSRVASGSGRRMAIGVAGIGVASLVLWQVMAISHHDYLWRYSLPARVWYFAPGMLLAVARLRWEESSTRRLPAILRRPEAWWLLSAPLWALAIWRDDYEAATALAGALVVGACVLPLRPSRLLDALQWKPLTALGIASYSLYLWHLPILRALENDSLTNAVTLGRHSFGYLLALGLALSCLVALLSYRLIESPFLRRRRRWATPPGSEAMVQAPLTTALPGVPAPSPNLVER